MDRRSAPLAHSYNLRNSQVSDFEKSSSCLQLTPTPHSLTLETQRCEVDREDKNGDETFLMVFASPSFETEGNPDKSVNSLFF